MVNISGNNKKLDLSINYENEEQNESENLLDLICVIGTNMIGT